jgi:hypothetical protein
VDGSELRVTDFVARPHRIRRYVIPAAAVLLIVFTLTGVFIRSTPTGATFHVSDEVAVIGVGILLAAATLLTLRPRVTANERGIEVRNVVNSKTLPWSEVRGVSFPDGAPWARVELLADEYYPAMAIQAHDGQRAVDAMRELRALYRTYTTPDDRD